MKPLELTPPAKQPPAGPLAPPPRVPEGVRCASISATRPPAEIGDSVSSIETPALMVDLNAFEANCASLQIRMQAYPTVSVRPHVKAHKCAEIAHTQLKLLGAKGVCCQKLSEAEAMVEGGIHDVLLSNEIVSLPKIRRMAALAASGAKISVCVDDLSNIHTIAEEARQADTSIELLVDINVGQDRCGVDTPEEALQLTEAILGAEGVSFGGIQAYHGGIQHVRDPRSRAAAVQHVLNRTEVFMDKITMQNIPLRVVTGAGTGTFEEHAESGLFTEVQPGSFCFGDADYARNVSREGELGEWQQSLWVLTTAMSRNEARSSIIVDAGMKAVSLDSGPPIVPETQTEGVAVEYRSGGDEHGMLLWPEVWQLPTELPPIGHMFRLIPGHCDPTVNLYDWIVAVRDDQVVDVWPIRGRGPGL